VNIEVGDLIWDNMASDIGIVVGLDHDRCVYTVWWDENSLLGRADTTGEAFTNFKEHPQHNPKAEPYCLLENREKYYEH
jgi:hypothetical protein